MAGASLLFMYGTQRALEMVGIFGGHFLYFFLILLGFWGILVFVTQEQKYIMAGWETRALVTSGDTCEWNRPKRENPGVWGCDIHQEAAWPLSFI